MGVKDWDSGCLDHCILAAKNHGDENRIVFYTQALKLTSLSSLIITILYICKANVVYKKTLVWRMGLNKALNMFGVMIFLKDKKRLKRALYLTAVQTKNHRLCPATLFAKPDYFSIIRSCYS